MAKEKKQHIVPFTFIDLFAGLGGDSSSCVSNILCTLIHGFLGKKQYAAMALSKLTMKYPTSLYVQMEYFSYFNITAVCNSVKKK